MLILLVSLRSLGRAFARRAGLSHRVQHGLVMLAVVACSIVAPRPALASITAVTLSYVDGSGTVVLPNPSGSGTVTCPSTLDFTGHVTGTNGQQFIWIYLETVNGTQSQSPVNMATITGTTQNVTFSVPVTSALIAGTSKFQLNTQTEGAQPTNFNSVSYPVTVTCKAVSPPVPPVPTGLTNTTDAQVCGQHIFALLCIGMSTQALALVWNWSPNANFSTLDGYNVYRITNGSTYTRVSHSVAGSGATGTLIPPSTPMPGYFDGYCYTVTAYKGSSESAKSDPFCVHGPGVITPVVIRTGAVSSLGVNRQGRGLNEGLITVGIGCAPPGETDNSQLCMGWSHWESGTAPFELFDDQWYRGYLTLSPKTISQTHNITKAVLDLTVDAGNIYTCLGPVGIATAQWQGSGTAVPGDFSDNLRPQMPVLGTPGSHVTFDVTNVVKDWASGARPDFGFVFMGTQENNSTFENKSCMFSFKQDPILTIFHY